MPVCFTVGLPSTKIMQSEKSKVKLDDTLSGEGSFLLSIFRKLFRVLGIVTDGCRAEYEKAWLIKVATNHCRDIQRFRFRHPRVPIEELAGTLVSQQEDREAIRELLHMPPKQRAVMVLHYVEGYQVKEIAGILGITEHAVKKRLQRGREQFRTIWKEEYCR